MPKTITIPELEEGEIYAGIILNERGWPDHHVILLPGDSDDAEWQKQRDWAKEQGGDLPTRREQSLLFANCKQHFEQDWYWSNEEYASVSGCAWFQGFGDGDQFYNHKSRKLSARAVRREFV